MFATLNETKQVTNHNKCVNLSFDLEYNFLRIRPLQFHIPHWIWWLLTANVFL
jgi:hypothetical protein